MQMYLCLMELQQSFMRQSALRCTLLQIIWAAHCFHGTFLIHVPAGQVTRVTSQFPFHTTSVENEQYFDLKIM